MRVSCGRAGLSRAPWQQAPTESEIWTGGGFATSASIGGAGADESAAWRKHMLDGCCSATQPASASASASASAATSSASFLIRAASLAAAEAAASASAAALSFASRIVSPQMRPGGMATVLGGMATVLGVVVLTSIGVGGAFTLALRGTKPSPRVRFLGASSASSGGETVSLALARVRSRCAPAGAVPGA